MPDSDSIALLERFMAAWNARDLDTLMECMADDCVFQASSGGDAQGTVFRGRQDVREAYAAVWKTFPDAAWNDATHFVCGSRAVSEWVFTGTDTSGKRTEVAGCDLFQLCRGRILVKNSFRKAVRG